MLRNVSAERFCPEALKEEIRASDSNQGSLVRVFAEGKEGSSLWFFSLRNTPHDWVGLSDLGLVWKVGGGGAGCDALGGRN